VNVPIVNPTTRKNIRKLLWDAIAELSDIDYQVATWGKMDNPHFTFVEFAESYFDCISDGVDDAVRHGMLSESESNTLRPMDDALRNYKTPGDDDYDIESILNDLAWKKVVSISFECREKLKLLLNSDDAVELLRSIKSVSELRSSRNSD